MIGGESVEKGGVGWVSLRKLGLAGVYSGSECLDPLDAPRVSHSQVPSGGSGLMLNHAAADQENKINLITIRVWRIDPSATARWY